MSNDSTRKERQDTVNKLLEKGKIEYWYNRYKGNPYDTERELKVLDDLEDAGVVERRFISQPKGCERYDDYTLFTLKK